MQINHALNYGSKNELINAFKKMIKKKSKISEENIKNQEIVGLKMTGLKNRVSGKNRLNVFEADLVEQKLKS